MRHIENLTDDEHLVLLRLVQNLSEADLKELSSRHKYLTDYSLLMKVATKIRHAETA